MRLWLFPISLTIGALLAGASLATTTAGPGAACADAAPTDLPFQLKGASVYSQPGQSIASIATYGARGEASSALYSVNACTRRTRRAVGPCQRLPGGHNVVAIGRQSVCIENATTHELERVTTARPATVTAAAPPRAPARKARRPSRRQQLTDEIAAGIERTSDHSFSVSRASIQKAQENLAQLSTHGRFVPAYENGQQVGFKLSRVRSGAVFKELGLKRGDVVTGVNGYDISSPDQALMLYQKLKDGQDFSVDVKRRGQNMTLDYQVR